MSVGLLYAKEERKIHIVTGATYNKIHTTTTAAAAAAAGPPPDENENSFEDNQREMTAQKGKDPRYEERKGDRLAGGPHRKHVPAE
ncbi:hypothetical protein Trydic_g20980 [Trypoxylus dichotomus]